MDNRDKILKAMKELGKPVKPGEVAKITRLDDKEVNKIFKELKSEVKIISPKRCFYSVSK
jgi:hypothetical protein